MDRKGITAVVAAVLVLAIWQLKFAPKFAPPTPPPDQAAASPSPGTAGTAATSSPTAATAALSPGQPTAVASATAEPSAPEQITAISEPMVKYRFTNHGGGIASAELTSYPAESDTNYVVINQYGSLPIGALSEKPGEGVDAAYTVAKQDNTILCTRDQPDGLSISKKFTLPTSGTEGQAYHISLEVTFANHGAQPVKSNGYYLYMGSAAPVHQNDISYYTAFDWDADAKAEHTTVELFNGSKLLGSSVFRDPPPSARLFRR